MSLNEKAIITTHVVVNEQVLNQNQNQSVADILSIDAKEQKPLKKDTLKHNNNITIKSKQMSPTSPQYKIVSAETLDMNDNANKTMETNEYYQNTTENQLKNAESNAELGLGNGNVMQPATVEKSEAKNKNIKYISGHVVGGGNSGGLGVAMATQIPKMNATAKLFKPILNFIGIDAPSGTLMDNLFKEFGSLISGNLHITSVDINILGKQQGMSNNNNNTAFNESNKGTTRAESVKYRSFYSSKKSNFFNMSNSSSMNSDQNRVITTILSFDSLLFNINVRQVFPTRALKTLKSKDEPGIEMNATVKGKKDGLFSMVNPIYEASKNADNEAATLSVYEPKYYTKVDTGIQLNNLSQEVNMPLLRLVHQLYSLIADAIEFDKEPNKFATPDLFVEDVGEFSASANRHGYSYFLMLIN